MVVPSAEVTVGMSGVLSELCEERRPVGVVGGGQGVAGDERAVGDADVPVQAGGGAQAEGVRGGEVALAAGGEFVAGPGCGAEAEGLVETGPGGRPVGYRWAEG